MARQKKFSDEQLRQYLAMDFSHEEIARYFNVSVSAVKQRVQKLERPAAVSGTAVVREAQASVWDTKRALEENYQRALSLLDDCEGAFEKKQVVSEIRSHIKQGMDVLIAFYSVQEVAAFQEEVLRVLDECEPGSRERILSRLRSRRSIRAAFDGGAGSLPDPQRSGG